MNIEIYCFSFLRPAIRFAVAGFNLYGRYIFMFVIFAVYSLFSFAEGNLFSYNNLFRQRARALPLHGARPLGTPPNQSTPTA